MENWQFPYHFGKEIVIAEKIFSQLIRFFLDGYPTSRNERIGCH